MKIIKIKPNQNNTPQASLNIPLTKGLECIRERLSSAKKTKSK